MKLILERTDDLVEVDGRPARIWRGTTAQGVPVLAFIAAIAVEESYADQLGELERDLLPRAVIFEHESCSVGEKPPN